MRRVALNIRFARAGDTGEISSIYAPIVERTTISFETEAPSPEEIADRITQTLGSFPWLVCERDGEVVGYAYGGAHRSRSAYKWSVDVSAYVREDTRRSGIGRALYTSLVGVLGRQGFYNAYAGITLPNDPSVGLHEAMGFRQIGVYRRVGYKLGGWRDVGWWGLDIRTDSSGEPEPPVAPSALGDDSVDEALQSGVRFLRR